MPWRAFLARPGLAQQGVRRLAGFDFEINVIARIPALG
jgi:hypothetical protein